jgi:phage protein U
MAGWATQLIVGGIEFRHDTLPIDSFKISGEQRWPAQERIARELALQWVGPGKHDIAISGSCAPQMGVAALPMLKALEGKASTGEPQMVTTGYGDVLGRYCIISVEWTGKSLLDDLRPRKVDWSVSLQKYGEDGQK